MHRVPFRPLRSVLFRCVPSQWWIIGEGRGGKVAPFQCQDVNFPKGETSYPEKVSPPFQGVNRLPRHTYVHYIRLFSYTVLFSCSALDRNLAYLCHFCKKLPAFPPITYNVFALRSAVLPVSIDISCLSVAFLPVTYPRGMGGNAPQLFSNTFLPPK